MIKQFFKDLLASFTNKEGGLSARKLTAFAFMVFIAYIHHHYVDKDNAIDALWADIAGVMLCLGLITTEQLISLRTGQKEEKKDGAN